MEKTDLKTKNFYVDPEKIEQLDKQKGREYLSLFLGIVVIICGFLTGVVADRGGVRASDIESMETVKTVLIIAGIIIIVASFVMLFVCAMAEKRVSQIYLTLAHDRVHGLCFDTSEFVGRTFSIAYTDITRAWLGYTDNGDRKYICIESAHGRYSCYDLENGTAIVKMINERIEIFKEKAKAQPPAAKSETEVKTAEPIFTEAEQHCIHCMYCGTELPKEAMFCPHCGKSQKQS